MTYQLPKSQEMLLDLFKKMQTGEGVGSISEVALDILAGVIVDQIITEYTDTAFRSSFPIKEGAK